MLGLTPGEYYDLQYMDLLEVYLQAMPTEVGELQERLAGLPFLLVVVLYLIKDHQGTWKCLII